MRFDYYHQLHRRFRLDLNLVADVDPETGRRLRKGFETELEVRAEDSTRAMRMEKILPGGGSGWQSNQFRYGDWRERQRFAHLPPVTIPCDDIRQLKERLLASCDSGRHIESLSSSFAMRYLRLSVIGAVLEGLERYGDGGLRTFTVLNSKWVYTPAELLNVSATTIKNQFLTHLRRIGVCDVPGPLIAFPHGEFEPTSGKYFLHFHGVTTVEKYRVLLSMADPELNWGYVPTFTGAAPIRSETVNDRMRQFSYLLKSYWPQKTVRWINGNWKRDRRPQRIREPYGSIALIWLDRQSPADITVAVGCRFSPSGRLSVVEAEAVVGEG